MAKEITMGHVLFTIAGIAVGATINTIIGIYRDKKLTAKVEGEIADLKAKQESAKLTSTETKKLYTLQGTLAGITKEEVPEFA